MLIRRNNRFRPRGSQTAALRSQATESWPSAAAYGAQRVVAAMSFLYGRVGYGRPISRELDLGKMLSGQKGRLIEGPVLS